MMDSRTPLSVAVLASNEPLRQTVLNTIAPTGVQAQMATTCAQALFDALIHRTTRLLVTDAASAHAPALAAEFQLPLLVIGFTAVETLLATEYAQGAIMASSPPAWLRDAMRAVLAGDRYLDARLQRLLDARLSPREQQILCAILAGETSFMTARRLDVAATTVRHHYRNLRAKLGLQHNGECRAWLNAQPI